MRAPAQSTRTNAPTQSQTSAHSHARAFTAISPAHAHLQQQQQKLVGAHPLACIAAQCDPALAGTPFVGIRTLHRRHQEGLSGTLGGHDDDDDNPSPHGGDTIIIVLLTDHFYARRNSYARDARCGFVPKNERASVGAPAVQIKTGEHRKTPVLISCQ